MKKPLYERFQELAGIKPLYEVGNLNLITEQTSSGNDPDCFACINNSVATVPLSQITYQGGPADTCGWHPYPSNNEHFYVDLAALNNAMMAASGSTCGAVSSDPDCFACINDTVEILPLSQMSSTGGGITMCGWSNQGSTGQWGGYYVDLAALNNNLTNVGSGSCGSGGGNPPSTGSCDVSQAAMSQIAGGNPQLGDFGINQNFVNNMAGKSDNFYHNRMQAFRSKRESLEISGQAYCQGENPNWQVKLLNKEKYAQRCIIKYMDPNQTNC